MFSIIRKYFVLDIIVIFLFVALSGNAFAYDISEKFTVEGTLTGVYQYGDLDIDDVDDADRGAVVFDLGTNFHPTEKDEFQITLSFAAGNGLNYMELFSLAPYADDLEDDLKDINGRNRDYLLEAWYKHTFKFSEDVSLGLTGGIIDATAYIDDNSFANDEVAQFMNDSFVNNPLANLPSYDIGGVADLSISNLSLKGLFMSSKNEEDSEYNYYALQLAYKLNTDIGEGNYRIYGFTTNDKFTASDGADEKNLMGVGISIDQQVSKIIGIFARLGWQDDSAIIDHDQIYSGGINLNGDLWGRKDDVFGVGYSYLNGADNGEIDKTDAFEAYAKFKVSDFSDVTVDFQYISDNMRRDQNQDGLIYGMRVNAYF